jgi:hypothetical protein
MNKIDGDEILSLSCRNAGNLCITNPDLEGLIFGVKWSPEIIPNHRIQAR